MIVQRRLSGRLDPLGVFAALKPSEPAERLLFEGKDGPTLLMQAAAVRAECRGDTVTLHALTPNGESLLRTIAAQAGESTTGGLLVLHFPASRSHDAAERLLAPTPLHALRLTLQAAMPKADDPFAVAALGVIAFDYAAIGEDLPPNPEDPLAFPDYLFWVPESLLLFDPDGRTRILCPGFPDPEPQRAERNHHDAVVRLANLLERCAEPLPSVLPTQPRPAQPECDLDDTAFAEVVTRMKEEIAAGEVYQIVPSRTFRASCREPLAAYAALRGLEPNAYRFFVEGPDFVLLGASPETSVRVSRRDAGLDVEVRPIAGTRSRGATADEDDRIEADMRLDGKELAEHMMLIDLARNDVARISETGTRRVARLLTVERYARVMHLVSSVTGRLRPELDALHALDACLNVGTLTGAPKIRATELLRQTEHTRRGPYGGAIGWLNGAGEMDTAVVIRSALVRDGVAHVRAGAGVVHDSAPLAEAEETRRKASALLSILGGASRQ